MIKTTQLSLKSDFSGGPTIHPANGNGPQGGTTPKVTDKGGPTPVSEDGLRTTQTVFKPHG